MKHLRLPFQGLQETLSVAIAGLQPASGGLYQGRRNVRNGDQLLRHGAGPGHPGPSRHQAGTQAVVIAGPFREGQTRALLAADHENGIVPQATLFQLFAHLADQLVEI